MRKSTCTTLALALLLHAPHGRAAEDDEPPPPPTKAGVRITFLPPPLEGTLSLGLFDKAGKLVRVLHREATTKEFTVGLNGLITFWDGRDDAGQMAPAGKYSAHGFAVGGLTFAGEAFHGNEWVGENGQPRLQRITDLRLASAGVQLWAQLPDAKTVLCTATRAGEIEEIQPNAEEHFSDPKWSALSADGERFAGQPITVLDGTNPILALCDHRLLLRTGTEWRWLEFPSIHRALHACLGREESVWVIDQTESAAIEVKQYSFAGEFQRRLTIDPNDPPPTRIAADAKADVIALLETSPAVQRVRLLTHVAGAAPAGENDASSSTWRVSLTKTIRSTGELPAAQSDLKISSGAPFTPEEKLTVRTLPNQLVRNASTSVLVKVGVDAKGSFLATHDGLPLKRIADTPHLRWAALMRDPATKAVTIFQSDGAVIEEFQARKLTSMMAFDAGDYEWAGK